MNQVPKAEAEVRISEVAQEVVLVERIVNKGFMEIPNGVSRPVRLVKGDALVEAKDPIMVA